MACLVNLYKFANGENLQNWRIRELIKDMFPHLYGLSAQAFRQAVHRKLKAAAILGWIEIKIVLCHDKEKDRWQSIRFVHILDHEYTRHIQQFKILRNNLGKIFESYGPTTKVHVGGNRFVRSALPTDIGQKNQKWYTELRPFYVSGKIDHLAVHNVDNLDLRRSKRGVMWDAPRRVPTLLKIYKEEVLRGE